MSEFSHCAVCGRKLRDAVFCQECERAICLSCVRRHANWHLVAWRQPTASADLIALSGEVSADAILDKGHLDGRA
jgi:hypothetical protein